MAEFDNPSIGNFSIEDTMTMGMGNKELLDGLYATETVTSNASDIKEIKDEEKKPQDKKAPNTQKKQEDVSKDSLKEPEDKTKPLTDFLSEEDEEDEEKEEKPSKKKEEVSPEDGNVPEENRFSALSKDLFKLGVFSKDEEEGDIEITSPEQFLERFNYEKKKGAIEVVDNFIGQFGEDYQKAFDAIFVKGVDPREYFSTFTNIQDFSSMDLKDENSQIAVVRQSLLDQGYEAEEIPAEIERLKNYGDLEKVAQKNHKVLIKKEAAKLAQLEKENETKLQQQAAIKHQYSTNVQNVLQEKLKAKEFDGIPLNPKLASELQDFLITDKYKTPSGETLTEFDRTILDLKRPENHEKKVKVALLLKILEKDPTLSTIQKTGVTKQSDALFGELARQSTKTSVKSTKTDKPSSWFVNT